MKLERGKVYAVTGAVGFNLALFILSAQFLFLKTVHHHWVLPWVAATLGIQMILAESLASSPYKSLVPTFRTTLLGLLLFSCLVGLARYETILTCYQHCGFKLALMLGLSGLIFGGSSFRYAKGSAGIQGCRAMAICFLGIGLFVWKISH